MLDKIMEAVGGDAISKITGEAGVTPEQAQEMLPIAQESLQEGLMSQMTSGNTEGLLGMFNSVGGGGLMSNGIFGSIKGLFMQKIMSKMGLPSGVAGLAAGAGMGSMIGGISNMLKSDGDNDDIDSSNIMNVLGGGGGMLGGLKDAAAGMLGGAGEGAGGMMDSLKDAAGGLLGGDAAEGEGMADKLKDAAADKLSGLFGK